MKLHLKWGSSREEVSYLRWNGKYFIVMDSEKPVDRWIKETESNTLMMERIQPSEIRALYHTIHIHSLFCLTTVPKPLPKRPIHRERYIASSSNFHRLFSLRLPSSCLRILPRLPITFTLPPIYPLTTCFRKQCLCKMWPIHWAFCFLLNVGYYFHP
jgi:hypothetical protein